MRSRLAAEHQSQAEGGHPRNFLKPCLLLLLAESASHGYELLERLHEFGFQRDPGGLYRTLRALEQAGLVRSGWMLSDHGPDRRRYQITAEGEASLRAWVPALKDSQLALARYLARYRRLEGRKHILGDRSTRDNASPGGQT